LFAAARLSASFIRSFTQSAVHRQNVFSSGEYREQCALPHPEQMGKVLRAFAGKTDRGNPHCTVFPFMTDTELSAAIRRPRKNPAAVTSAGFNSQNMSSVIV
jgi:hypothetical protein